MALRWRLRCRYGFMISQWFYVMIYCRRFVCFMVAFIYAEWFCGLFAFWICGLCESVRSSVICYADFQKNVQGLKFLVDSQGP